MNNGKISYADLVKKFVPKFGHFTQTTLVWTEVVQSRNGKDRNVAHDPIFIVISLFYGLCKLQS